MRTVRLLLLLALLAPGRAAAQTPAPSFPTITIPQQAERVLRDYEAAWTGRSPARLAALFHPEGFVLSNGKQAVKGRTAIEKHYQNAGGPLHLRPIAFTAADTVAYIIGMYGARPGEDGGKFVLVLRRSNARQPWLIGADMDNPLSRQSP